MLAAADGVVALVADHFFGGRSVFVDHGDGLLTMYFHLSRADVAEGQELRRGERARAPSAAAGARPARTCTSACAGAARGSTRGCCSATPAAFPRSSKIRSMALGWHTGPLRHLSIRRKLNLIVLVTSGVAVLLASAVFLLWDYSAVPRAMVAELETTAEGVGLLAYPALAADLAGTRAGDAEREVFVQIVGSLQARAAIEESVIFDAAGLVVGGHQRNILRQRPRARLLEGQLARLHGRGPDPVPPRGGPARALRRDGVPALEHGRAHGAARPLRDDPGG